MVNGTIIHNNNTVGVLAIKWHQVRKNVFLNKIIEGISICSIVFYLDIQ